MRCTYYIIGTNTQTDKCTNTNRPCHLCVVYHPPGHKRREFFASKPSWSQHSNINIFILILYLTLRLSQLCVGFLISGPKLFHRILAHFCVHKLACRHIFILSGLELKREKCGREKKGFNIQMWKKMVKFSNQYKFIIHLHSMDNGCCIMVIDQKAAKDIFTFHHFVTQRQGLEKMF